MTERKPEIRFAGYKDNWDIKRFGDVFDILSNNTLSRDNLNDESGVALNVHYGDVLIKFGEYLDVSKEKLPYISDEAIAAKFQSSFLNDGDIVIADTAEDETVGKCTEICNVGDKNVLPGLHTIPCRPKEQFAAMFLGYYMNSKKYHDQLLPLMQGVKVTSISRSGLQNTDIILPPNIHEQANISLWLAMIDEKISVEKKKFEKMIVLKKAMLGKMFPQKGMLIPEIRFEEYTGVWEQRKLGDLVEISDIDHRMPETVSDGIPYLMTGDFTEINELNFKDVKLISKQDYELLSRKIKPEKGDIIFARYASVGAVRYIDFTRKFLVSYSCAIIKKGKMIDSKFLYHFLTSDVAQKQIQLEINAGSQANIGIDSMKKNIYISMPSMGEQAEIAKCLDGLDNLISLHQRRIQMLENIKSTCMQKMFV